MNISVNICMQKSSLHFQNQVQAAFECLDYENRRLANALPGSMFARSISSCRS